MSGKPKPSILLLYPSYFYHPSRLERDELKSALLLLGSYLAQDYPVEYADLEISIGRPATGVQVKRYARKVREFLEKRRFDILALSCWTSLSYNATMTTAKIARELYPNCLIVVGGYHPTAVPEDFVSDDNLFDYVIRGEGELALKDIVEGFGVSGRPSETRIVDGPTLYPDKFVGVNWELVDRFIETNFPDGIGTVCLYLSRGCPFACAFCMESLKERSWRPYTPERAIEQIRFAIERYRIQAIAIGDACFGVRPKWRKEFLNRLVDLNPSQWILVETRPEYLDEEDVEMLSRFDTEIQIGLESCSPQMLRIMNKTKQPEKFLDDFRRVSHLLSDHGVIHGANLIFNHPGETQKTLEETFAFMDEETKRPDSSLIWACHGYLHFPGSALDRNQAQYEQEYGAQFLSPGWWRVDDNPFTGGRNVIPSRDLIGDRIDLWQQMLQERDEALKGCLTPKAFQLAANTYFPAWRSDPRYTGF
jgi:radical SAM superfamily enzyme YgiQ (UPF0313 family)